MPTTTTRLLDRYKEVRSITSDYEAAKALEVTRATVSRWRHGGTMDEATALKVAAELGIEPLAVLAEVNLDRRLTTRDRRIWESFRARVGMAALAAIAAAAFGGLTPSTSHAGLNTSEGCDNVYIMRRFWQWLLRGLIPFAGTLSPTALPQRLRPTAPA